MNFSVFNSQNFFHVDRSRPCGEAYAVKLIIYVAHWANRSQYSFAFSFELTW